MASWFRPTATGLLAASIAGACGGAPGASTTTHPECLLYYGGGDIPLPPDGASLCAPGVCNYEDQTGCKAGEACTPVIDSAKETATPTCRAPGPAKRGEACSDKHLCGAGLFCAAGTCHALCCGGDWSVCGPGESCIRQAELKVDTGLVDAGLIYAGFDLCFPVGTCDVFDTKACVNEDRVCRIVDPTGAVACAPPSDLKAGDPCDHDRQCGQGLLCAASLPLDAGTTFKNGSCRKLCRFSACGEPSCTPSEGTCVHFEHDPPGVGECTPDWLGPGIPADGGAPSDAGVSSGDGAAQKSP